MKLVKILDTTLRDGEQSPGCSMNISEKINLAKQIDKLGVDIIEAGFAIASPGDFTAVSEIAKVVENASVSSLARAVEKDIDAAYDAVKYAKKPRIHVFLATSEIHMKYKLKMTREQVLERAAKAVAYAKSKCDDIEFSAEDASRTDREFLVQVYEAVIKAGATAINVPDTVGYSTPEEMYDLIKYLHENVKGIENVNVSVHCHNDLGLGVANSLASMQAGANIIECTINGIGERAGNAALEEIVMALHTRKDKYNAYTNIDTTEIYATSKLLSKITGIKVQPNKAIVGDNAFAHESGVHQHGVLANRETYEIMSPETIGLKSNKLVLGKHSGKHALRDRIKEFGYIVDEEELEKIFVEFKKLADRLKLVSDADIEALLYQNRATEIPEEFKLDYYLVYVGNTVTSVSSVKVTNSKGESKETTAMSKFGPINASYKAISEVVGEQFDLVDFKIEAITGGTDAQGVVTLKLNSNGKTFNGHGVGVDIIEAAITAYIVAINNIFYDRKLTQKTMEENK